MALSLTKDQIAELQEVFRMMDKNSDGFITSADIVGLIQSLNENPRNEEVQKMMSRQVQVDTNGDGIIDFQEFLIIMSKKMMKNNGAEELREAFKVFDRDQDGYISPNELRHVMINMGERLNDEELEQMIKEADLDGDGVISYEEFVRVMMLTA